MNLCFHFLWVKVPTHQKLLFVTKMLVHSTLQRSIIASFSIDGAKVLLFRGMSNDNCPTFIDSCPFAPLGYYLNLLVNNLRGI